jgi:hypothetical protein
MKSKLNSHSTPQTALDNRKPRNALQCDAGGSKEESEQNLARFVTSPQLAAYRVIGSTEAKSGLGDQIDVPHLIEQLRREAIAVNRGDLAHAESMLTNQATALQSVFARLTERAMASDTIVAFEANMRMALRAQSQSEVGESAPGQRPVIGCTAAT